MKLLIPSQCIEFTGEVQQVLLLAEKQGFDISAIELGVSSTLYIELVATHTSRISSSLFAQHTEDHRQADLLMLYGHDDFAVDRFNSLSQIVQIDVELSGRLADRWFNQEVETRLVNAQPLADAEYWRHLAWIVTSLALEFPLEDALVLSRAALNVSRETWPTQFKDFPQLAQPYSDNKPSSFVTLTKPSLGLYPVVDSVEWIERLLALGLSTVQLRIKDPNHPQLEQQIATAIKLGEKYRAQVFINDYWQLALKHNAFGVHLGQEDISQADLTNISDKGIALGLSTHGYFELLRIHQLSPSYIALGHIFPTTTKQMPSKPQGLVRLGLYQKLLDSMPYGESFGIPSVAIGGIDLSNIQQVVDQGVSSVAVVRAVTEASDVKAAVEQLQSKLLKTTRNDMEGLDVI